MGCFALRHQIRIGERSRSVNESADDRGRVAERDATHNLVRSRRQPEAKEVALNDGNMPLIFELLAQQPAEA